MLWEESIFLAALGLSFCPDPAGENGGAGTIAAKGDSAPRAANPGIDAGFEAGNKPLSYEIRHS